MGLTIAFVCLLALVFTTAIVMRVRRARRVQRLNDRINTLRMSRVDVGARTSWAKHMRSNTVPAYVDPWPEHAPSTLLVTDTAYLFDAIPTPDPVSHDFGSGHSDHSGAGSDW
jgi:hypothetical protein